MLNLKQSLILPNKIIVFDMDDTLYLERDYVKSGFAKVSNWISTEFNKQDFFEIAWNLFCKGERGQIFNKSLEILDISADEMIVGNCVEIYRNHFPKISLLEDAEILLSHLDPRVATGLITDGPRNSQENKILALGLNHKITNIVVTDSYDSSWTKPSPKPYLFLMSNRDNAPADFIYVGDNPHKDFISPLKLGWSALRVRRPGSLHYEIENQHPDLPTVSSLDTEELSKIDFFREIYEI